RAFVVAVRRVRRVPARRAARLGAHRGIAEAVAVGVAIERGQDAVVDAAFAVVVAPVADLGRAGPTHVASVVAVVCVLDVPGRSRARFGVVRGIAAPVAVGVAVVRRRDALVGGAVAVVVLAVAGLGGAGPAGAAGVVAVVGVVDVRRGRAARFDAPGRVAAPVAVGVEIIGGLGALVGGAVAVVVLAVATLTGAGPAGAAGVVAVVGVVDVAGGRAACVDHHGRVAAPVSVGVGVVG